jgi:hypothetical protein
MSVKKERTAEEELDLHRMKHLTPRANVQAQCAELKIRFQSLKESLIKLAVSKYVL